MIDYTSDLHLDFVLGNKGQHTERRSKLIKVKMGFKSTDAELLLIAGDLGHYNKQNIEFLKEMTKQYRYIILIHGNHDLYLLSKSQQDKYKGDSFNRLREFREAIKELENVYYLDGEMIEIEGIKIAGASLWYDYTYGLERGLQAWEIQKYFMENSNDSKKIMKPTINVPHVYDHFSKPKTFIDNLEYAAEQKAKLLKVVKQGDPDIIISHIPPDHALCEGTGKTKNDPLLSGSLYSCDTSEFDPYIKGKVWIFGHVHDVVHTEKRGCQFLAAPFGYYGREKNNPFGTIEIDKVKCKNISWKKTTIQKEK